MSPEFTGALTALLVPLCFGTGMLLARVGLVHIPPGAGNFVSIIVGWVLIASITAVLHPDALFGITLGAFAWLAMIGIINFPAGRFLNFVSIKNLGILRANPVLAMAPIISAFEGVVFLDERLNWAIAGGTLLTVTGVIVAVYGEVMARGGEAPRPAAPRRRRMVSGRGSSNAGHASSVISRRSEQHVPTAPLRYSGAWPSPTSPSHSSPPRTQCSSASS